MIPRWLKLPVILSILSIASAINCLGFKKLIIKQLATENTENTDKNFCVFRGSKSTLSLWLKKEGHGQQLTMPLFYKE
jgi:hypothetical protein